MQESFALIQFGERNSTRKEKKEGKNGVGLRGWWGSNYAVRQPPYNFTAPP